MIGTENGQVAQCKQVCAPVSMHARATAGGHTAEMLRATAALDKSCYRPRIYVYAATDNFSANKAKEAEKLSPSCGEAPDFCLRSVPRSREVGQSYVTSVLTTLRAIAFAFVVVWQERPDVLLANGPGTCIPLCFAVLVFRQLRLMSCSLIYIESIARVCRLSLSGKILYHLQMADSLLVQWPELQKHYPRTNYAGRVY
ncbi:oligosaccharide biosynthesis protein Alg14-like protein [Dunaliella salina]|uniref:UDP-N-acetylglucosamine transferase subunit ALG14 n=1 Tax=Dunaliella salina TaxID=3046 RepID=A0ABQ7GVE1_DUNSA|nr:oligosaccharide biosynthesis protein Alg14-like protein [Dunaliella salina]|eukprot:KAF5838583.1 oligosaccharide biosynthesis protein Alg14-like protein [Dunaliella salina]